MSNPDFRALCAELADALAEWQLGGGPPEDTTDADLIARARAALDQPAPVAPTDEKLDDLADDFLDWNCEGWRAYARAVLACCARPTIQPVPAPTNNTKEEN